MSPKLVTQTKGDQIFLGTLNHVPYFAVQTDDGISANLLIAVKWCVKKICRSQESWHKQDLCLLGTGKPVLFSMRQRNSSGEGGQLRRCPACNATTHPRIDPVVIMLIEHPDDQNLCLLGKSQGRMASSTFIRLCGFCRPGRIA